MSTPLLSIRDLRVRFPSPAGPVDAVSAVDLDVFPGECLGVVGESGSGKSATFLAMLGLLPSATIGKGAIAWKGRAIDAATLRGREIALTLQNALTALNPALRIGTQIEETLAAHDQGGNRRERAIALLRRVGIADPARRLHAYPHELSGGMRQRAMIAVALACSPELLIADEPTTALDVTVQAQVLDLLRALRAKQGMSLVLITHNLAVAAGNCDRIAVMYAGEIVETGPAARVLTAPRHPYTIGLMRSHPSLDDLDAPLLPIPGRIPGPGAWPEGCRFAARCSHHVAACDAPQMLRAAPGGAVRCCQARLA
jgi:oligopeptide/dipeptide ABC transporter ATP-binding protein